MVFVGDNFRFGRDGSGTLRDLAAFGDTHGFGVRGIPLLSEAGEAVSSTRIRSLLAEGDVRGAAELLGRPHRVQGKVVSGAGRGRDLGAPTANVEAEDDLMLPSPGVYLTHTAVEGPGAYDSVTSVGTNPTFGKGEDERVESLLLGYEGDLYGRTIAVDFLERLRAQEAFPDKESLRKQIARDVERAREMHALAKKGPVR
jgi:riboflavin kinase/FMN adenylyltransferase